MSKVTVTIDFPNILAAADALALIGGLPATQPGPKVVVVLDDQAATLAERTGTTFTPVVTPTPAPTDTQSLPQPPADKPARKPRADAGRTRGPHKDTTLAAPEKATAEPQSATPPVVVAPAAADPSAKPTKEDAIAALGRINKTAGMGMPACMEFLKLFGVNRISILPPESFALFIKQADEKIAEHLAAAGK